MSGKRLDVYLHEHGLAESRTKARELIERGDVLVNGEVTAKPSEKVPEAASVEITQNLKYVSKAGVKLETAVKALGIDFTGLVCLDAGASAGGFTDVMLQQGAVKVYAVDVGTGQLHGSLRENPRVISLEGQDVRTLMLPEPVDFITCDVSFISLKAVIPAFSRFLKENGQCAVLIKPQFEVGKRRIKNGIVKDSRLIENVVRDMEKFIISQGYDVIGIAEAGANVMKNREFICCIRLGSK